MIQQIGIIGAGQMGNGIAHVAALNGFDILLVDIDEEVLGSALETIRNNMSRQVRKELIDQDSCDGALARIKVGAGIADLRDCDLVIEAAAEDEESCQETTEGPATADDCCGEPGRLGAGEPGRSVGPALPRHRQAGGG